MIAPNDCHGTVYVNEELFLTEEPVEIGHGIYAVEEIDLNWNVHEEN